MKYDELDNPTCNRCGTPNLTAYGAKTDDQGNVLEVCCMECRALERLVEWDADHRLSSRNMIDATLRTFDKGKPGVDLRWFQIAYATDRLQDHIKKHFEPSVWFGHAGEPFTTHVEPEYHHTVCGFGKGRSMAKVVRPAKWRRLTSGDVAEADGTFTVKTLSSAGRCLIEIRSATAYVTLITAEDEDAMRMGIQELDATEAEALDLMNRAEMAWRAGAYTLVDNKA